MYASHQPISVTLPTRNFHHVFPQLIHKFPQYVQAFAMHDALTQLVLTSRIALELVTALLNVQFSGYAVLSNVPSGTPFRDIALALDGYQISVEQVSSELSAGGYVIRLSERALAQINQLPALRIGPDSLYPLVAVSTDYLSNKLMPAPKAPNTVARRYIGFRKSSGAVTRFSNGHSISSFRSWRNTTGTLGVSVLEDQ